VRSWPGWGSLNVAEPDLLGGAKPDIASIITVPTLTALISVTDIIFKVNNIFSGRGLITLSVSISAFIMMIGSVGLAFHSLTATEERDHPIAGNQKVLKYPKKIRVVSICAAVFVLSLWAMTAGYEYSGNGDLQIASASLPNSRGREMSLVIVNRGNTVRVLKEFQIMSRTYSPFMCASGDFEIPVAAEYILSGVSHLSNRLRRLDRWDTPALHEPRAFSIDCALLKYQPFRTYSDSPMIL
jgi:hypothetical protein